MNDDVRRYVRAVANLAWHTGHQCNAMPTREDLDAIIASVPPPTAQHHAARFVTLEPPDDWDNCQLCNGNPCRCGKLPPDTTEPAPERDHPDEWCQDCGRQFTYVWYAKDGLWERIVGSPNGILCAGCFDARSAKAGLTVFYEAVVQDRHLTDDPAPKPTGGRPRPANRNKHSITMEATPTPDIDPEEVRRAIEKWSTPELSTTVTRRVLVAAAREWLRLREQPAPDVQAQIDAAVAACEQRCATQLADYVSRAADDERVRTAAAVAREREECAKVCEANYFRAGIEIYALLRASSAKGE